MNSLYAFFFVSLGQGLLIDDFCYWQLIRRFLQISEDIPLNEMLPFCSCQKWKIDEVDTVGWGVPFRIGRFLVQPLGPVGQMWQK